MSFVFGLSSYVVDGALFSLVAIVGGDAIAENKESQRDKEKWHEEETGDQK